MTGTAENHAVLHEVSAGASIPVAMGQPRLRAVVMLTRHGRHLVDSGARLLPDLEAIEAGLHRQAGAVAGQLRVVAFSTAMRGLVAPAMADLLAAHPDLS